ncbi:MAG: hypothetical protein WKF57_03735 [Nakamurella sp.]
MVESALVNWMWLTVLACACALAVAAAEEIRPGFLTGRSQSEADDEMLPTVPAARQPQPRTLAAMSWWDRQKGLAELERFANSGGPRQS